MMEPTGRINIAVEDRFIILQLDEFHSSFPFEFPLKFFAGILDHFAKYYDILCDFRNVKHYTNELLEFIDEFRLHKTKFLVDKYQSDFFIEMVGNNARIFPVENANTTFDKAVLDLEVFIHQSVYPQKSVLDEWKKTNLNWNAVPDKEEFEMYDKLENSDPTDPKGKIFYDFEEYLDYLGYPAFPIQFLSQTIIMKRYLQDFINDNAKNSLLTQFGIHYEKDNDIKIIPYHANALHEVKQNQELLLTKPHIIARRFNSIYLSELESFQHLLNKPRLKESEIQEFLERRPNFIKNLGYKKLYPQIVLEREDGTSLQPDFLLEPIGDCWWDIMDIKLPEDTTVLTGQRDRFKFSESVQELHAQLREYAAYFENEKYARLVQEKYGIKCYKPKMIGIIGNKIPANNERQVRRVLTSYADFKVLTFEQLYNIAKSRILI